MVRKSYDTGSLLDAFSNSGDLNANGSKFVQSGDDSCIRMSAIVDLQAFAARTIDFETCDMLIRIRCRDNPLVQQQAIEY